MLIVMTVLTGLIYPLVITGIAQVVFPSQANGSLIDREGKPLAGGGAAAGSALIGQPFDAPQYFWGRPSATAPFPYHAGASTGSNWAVTNPSQTDAIKARVAKLRESGIPAGQPIPVDLVTASGSGLDPHISVAAARIQIARVASARGMSEQNVRRLVEQHIEARQFGIWGEPRVNVLRLNLALDAVRAESRLAAVGAP
ncbi:MAG: Potassium-transporting ATPase KdpC subunit [Phycisphaerae bacterium]|nr:Potassium-transporting ATPase KdpC subunit [Phycisphaerae bacterium]